MNQSNKIPTEEDGVEMGSGTVVPVPIKIAKVKSADVNNNEEENGENRTWKSKINGMVHNQSMRDLQSAIQSTCSFVFAALIAFKSTVKDDLSPGWFMVFLAPMLLTDTLGGTIVAGRGAVVNYTAGVILVYILQVLGMGYHTYTSSCVVFFILCFWMGYINPAMGPRKIALLLPAILFVAINATPNYLLPKYYVWDFLASGLTGIAVDVGIALLILPRYASFEVTDRFYYGLRRNAEVLELIFNAMLSQHKAESEIYLCEADELIRCMQENQDAIGMRAFLGSYEPVTILRWLFRSHHKVYNRFALSDFPLMNSTTFWHIACLAQAVRDVHFNEYHALTWRKSRLAFQGIATKYHDVIKLLGQPTDMWHVQDPVQIDAAIAELKLACDHMFATLSKALMNPELKLSEMGGMVLDMKNVCSPRNCADSASTVNGAETDSEPAHPHGEPKATPRSVSPCSLPRTGSSFIPTSLELGYDQDRRRSANRLSGSFFLFHLSEMIQSMDNRFSSSVASTLTPSLTLMQRATVWGGFLVSPLIATWAYCCAIVQSYGVDVRGKAIAGLRTAMLLGIGLIFCEVPKLVMKFENGQWILLAMLLSQSDNLGGTLYQARNRFLGTLAGAVYSYFVSVAVGDTNVYNIVAMYIPAVFVAGIIRQNKQWSYFGSIWVTTGVLITFGRTVAFPRVQDYLLLRIQENAVGILLAFAFSFLTIPVRATVLLQENVISVLAKMSAAGDKIIHAFNTHVTPERRNTYDAPRLSQKLADPSGGMKLYCTDSYTADDIAQIENIPSEATVTASPDIQYTLDHAELSALATYKRVQSLTYILPEAMVISQRMAQQPLLLEQSVMELIFISRPFPELTYTKLMACQKKVLHMMITIDRALLRISQFSELKVAHSSVLFGKRVSGEVRTLLAEVTANLDKWSKLLQCTLDTGGNVPVKDQSSHSDPGSFEEGRNSASTEDLEGGYHSIVSANHKHIELRRQHARGLEKMHRSAVLLAENCLTFTGIAWNGWTASLVSDNPHSSVKHSEASIHQLFDVLTTFNALFYASHQLANATVVMGNIMYTILTLENKSNHKSF